MISIEKNPESQLHLLDLISVSINPLGKRKRIKKSSFKILNAIFLWQKRDLELGRNFHFPCKETIATKAKVSRKTVTDFINSEDFKIFCDVYRSPFRSNQYRLKEWVFDWFRLFWRSGMMKHFHTKYEWWKNDFHKRLHKWLIAQVQEGRTCAEILYAVMNKLSTKKSPKVAAAKPLKVAGTDASQVSHIPSGSKLDGFALPSIASLFSVADTLSSRFHLQDGDLNMVINSFSLSDLKGGLIIRETYEKRGHKPYSPIASFIHCIQKHRLDKKIGKIHGNTKL